ncbi:MAG: YqaE/Pmp3 family membrane protein [Bacteroidota bacterium]|nr:YqaE/Pmp3 family membrane protein [Bacteroidota bacterium]
MVKKISFLIIAMVFIGSCTGKFSLQKRKYNKGFYFANTKRHSTKVKKETIHNTGVVNNLPTNKNINLASNKDDVEKSLALTEVNRNITKTSKFKEDVTEKKKNITASADKKSLVLTKVFKDLKIKSPKNKLGIAKKGDSDVDLIILVILCLFPFINLIAIYLKDSKSVTLNFWITLILDCLFFLPGIIFALLVVLDVVNLA